MMPTQPLMHTMAQQEQIKQERLKAEFYKLQLEQNQQTQNERIAQFVGAAMQRNKEREPHVTYNVYTGGPPPPAPPAAAPPTITPLEQMESRSREMREQDQQKLHEATAAAKQSVNQKMLEHAR